MYKKFQIGFPDTRKHQVFLLKNLMNKTLRRIKHIYNFIRTTPVSHYVFVHILCLAHLYLKLVQYSLCLDLVLYSCTAVQCKPVFCHYSCTHFALPIYSTVHLNCTLLVLVLTNKSQRNIDQSKLRFLVVRIIRKRKTV